MTSTLLSPPTLARHFEADILSATATLRQPQLSAPPSTAKMQIPHYKTAVLILHTATKPNAAVITQPSSLFQTGGSGPTSTLNPHTDTTAGANSPRGFLP